MQKGRAIPRVGSLTALLFLGLGFVSGHADAQAPKEIVIGASIPKSGVLAAFGTYEEWGYKTAVNEVNKAGGLQLSKLKAKVPVRLVLYDDESRPEKVTQNVERLILRDGAHALLGSATPPLVLSGAAVAERESVPMVTGVAPIRAFLGGREKWTWVWDIFFDELDMTQQQFLTMNMMKSNRKVALFTDNEQDGVVMGRLWNENAKKFDYKIVYHARFPVGTTEYGDLIRRAKQADAEVIIAQMITPDSIALWRQMQALGYRPKAAFFGKGAEPVEWWSALGKAAQGVMVAGYWHPDLGYPGAGDLRKRFERETRATYSQHIADTYAAAQVLLDAVERAGSLERKAVNEAIGKIDKTYAVGPVNFAKGPGGRTSALKTFMLQWQNGDLQIVYPEKQATAKLIYPLPPWSELRGK